MIFGSLLEEVKWGCDLKHYGFISGFISSNWGDEDDVGTFRCFKSSTRLWLSLF